ncbi:MAG: hypothetical protein IJN66_04350 [Muribaculaceae bacterium]|nr:hypothetical protein [Muribaculaceae bacterium]
MLKFHLSGREIGNGENVGWSNVTATVEGTHGAIPDYIYIYKATRLQNKNCVVYIAVEDLDKVTFNVLGDANSLKHHQHNIIQPKLLY